MLVGFGRFCSFELFLVFFKLLETGVISWHFVWFFHCCSNGTCLGFPAFDVRGFETLGDLGFVSFGFDVGWV